MKRVIRVRHRRELIVDKEKRERPVDRDRSGTVMKRNPDGRPEFVRKAGALLYKMSI